MLAKAYVGHLFDFETGKRLRLATAAEAAAAKRGGGVLVIKNRLFTIQHVKPAAPQVSAPVRVTIDQKGILRHMPKGSSIARSVLVDRLHSEGWRSSEIEHALRPLLESGVVGEDACGLFNARAASAVARRNTRTSKAVAKRTVSKAQTERAAKAKAAKEEKAREKAAKAKAAAAAKKKAAKDKAAQRKSLATKARATRKAPQRHTIARRATVEEWEVDEGPDTNPLGNYNPRSRARQIETEVFDQLVAGRTTNRELETRLANMVLQHGDVGRWQSILRRLAKRGYKPSKEAMALHKDEEDWRRQREKSVVLDMRRR